MHELVIPYLLTLIAGLSTGIGSAIAFFAKKTNTKFLAVSLGFSAGVMIYISFVELFPSSKLLLMAELGSKAGFWINVAAFFTGILFIATIDKLVPENINPHEARCMDGVTPCKKPEEALMRTGTFTALAIGIHNLPEGLAVFFTATQSLDLAIPIVIAIAIHNIPEGIAVSVPIYFATGSKRKAFKYSFLSGLAEPIGAIVGYLLLMPFMNDTTYGFILGAVSGIMVFISLDELLPAAREYGESHLSIYGLVGGMAVMAVSLGLFL